MPGDATHGYDLVLEFAEQFLQDLLSVAFDTADFLASKILGALGIDPSIADSFAVDLSFDRPTDITIPATAFDFIDVQVLLGEGGTGSLGALRFVVGIDVDRGSEFDLIEVNFKDKLFATSISIAGHNIPGLNTLFRNLLRDTIKVLPLVPVPVDRASTSGTTFIRADARVIDDTSPADKDALAGLLVFGGGTPGNAALFTQSFLSPGGRGGIAVAFPWLCRVISPAIDNALNLGGAFTNCRLTRSVRIDDDHEVDLTGLSLTMQDGFIAVSASVSKSGFCYDATGTVGARIEIAVENGHLIVKSHVDDPDVDIDVPWYCWLGAAILGAITGGLVGVLIGSVIPAIVGAVLVPLITWLATEAIEDTVQSVAQRVADAINNLGLDVDVPAVGINIIFSDVFLDDVEIRCQMTPIDTAPVRAQGLLRVFPGQQVDLDNGRVGGPDLPGADLELGGLQNGRTLRAVCGARMARTGRRDFDALARAILYRFRYDAPNPIPVSELATYDPFGIFTGGGFFDESDLVYAIRTNDGRYAIVQAVEVDLVEIVLRYKVWEKILPSLSIAGDFTCEGPGDVVGGTVVFEPSGVLTTVSGTAGGGTGTGTGGGTTRPPDPCAGLTAVVERSVPATLVSATKLAAVPLEARRIGQWRETVRFGRHPVGRFQAIVDHFGPGLRIAWKIDGELLSGRSGDIAVGSQSVHYAIDGTKLVLTTNATVAFEFDLSVTASDRRGNALTTQRCVKFDPRCDHDRRHVPTYAEYLSEFRGRFGVVEVPPGRLVSPDPPPVVGLRTST